MPLLKLRFVSITLKDANAKQSRVKLTLFGFTYTFHPDLAWVSDLSEFAKAPPGVRILRRFHSLSYYLTGIRASCPERTNEGFIVHNRWLYPNSCTESPWRDAHRSWRAEL